MKKTLTIAMVLCWVIICSADIGCADDEIYCEQYAEVSLKGNQFIVRNNVWGKTAGQQCIRVSDKSKCSFEVISTNHKLDPGGEPASYPCIQAGYHPFKGSSYTSPWQNIQIGNIYMLNSRLIANDINISGVYNIAYDIWVNPSEDTSQPTGIEIMVWLMEKGERLPAGKKIGQTKIKELLFGEWRDVEYDVYYKDVTPESPHKIVTFKRSVYVDEVASINLKNAIDFCITNSWCDPNSYLLAVEAGFEIWEGGVGLTLKDFDVTIESWIRPRGQVSGMLNYGYSDLSPLVDGNIDTWVELDEAPGEFGISFAEPKFISGVRFYNLEQKNMFNHITKYKVSGILSSDDKNLQELVTEKNNGSTLPGWTTDLISPDIYDEIKISYSETSYNGAPRVGELQFLTSSCLGNEEPPDDIVVIDATDNLLDAPVYMGDVLTAGKPMELSVNFPAYKTPVDIFILLVLPDGSWFVADESGKLLPFKSFVPIASGVSCSRTIKQILAPFEVGAAQNPFSLSPWPKDGTWTVYWLIAPENNGDIMAAINKEAYELGSMSFPTPIPQNPSISPSPTSTTTFNIMSWAFSSFDLQFINKEQQAISDKFTIVPGNNKPISITCVEGQQLCYEITKSEHYITSTNQYCDSNLVCEDKSIYSMTIK